VRRIGGATSCERLRLDGTVGVLDRYARVVYHFHIRTKTGRAKELREAAPDAFIQVNEEDARRLDIKEGEMLPVTSRRGAAEAPARIGDIEPGTLFIPFHYGYWDDPHRARAANELTLYEWDPVSKQPHFKYAAVKLAKVESTLLPQPDESKLERLTSKKRVDRSSEYNSDIASIFVPSEADSLRDLRLLLTYVAPQRILLPSGRRNWSVIRAAAEDGIRQMLVASPSSQEYRVVPLTIR
jgi:hypothetical protein